MICEVAVKDVTVPKNRLRELGDYSGLAVSMAGIGLLQPIVVSESRVLVSGRQRLEAAKRLGWETISARVVEDDELLNRLAEIDENLRRFDLTVWEQAKHAVELERVLDALGQRARRGDNRYSRSATVAGLEKTTGEVAEEAGVSERTWRRRAGVGRGIGESTAAVLDHADPTDEKQRNILNSTTQLDHLANISRARGDAMAAEVAEKALSEDGGNTFKAYERIKRRERNESAALCREEREAELEASGFSIPDFRHEDFRESRLSEPLDAIVTDPPYPKGFLGLYEELGGFAARNLKPGGVLLAMAGQSYLPEVLEALGGHLRYVWTIAYIGFGGNVTVYPRKVQSGWKPVLLFVNGDGYEGRSYVDYVRSDAADKKYHEWGQSESGFAALVEAFTEAGELVCDPFLGGGTVGVVAFRLKRRFVGMEVDAASYETARERLGEETA